MFDILQIRNEDTTSVVVPGNIDWEYDFYSLPPDSHLWSDKHDKMFTTEIFTDTGERHGRSELTRIALFTGMLLHDKEFVDGQRDHTSQYPLVSAELRNAVIQGTEIDDYIMPWCRLVERQLWDAEANKIVSRPLRSPWKAKTWDQQCEFLMSLSREGDYRKAIRSIEALAVRLFVSLGMSLMHSIQDLPESIGDTLLPAFSRKYLLHYAGSDAHTDWKTWGQKTLKTVNSALTMDSMAEILLRLT
jgi:hypothetical protein